MKFYAKFNVLETYQFSSVTESCPTLCKLWIAACQASQSKTNSWCLFRLMSIELVMPSNHLILCCPLLLLPQSYSASGSFPIIQFFASSGQNIGASTSASVLPKNIHYWFSLGSTDLISFSPRNSQESSPTPQFKSINSSALSFIYGPSLTSIHNYWKNYSFGYRYFCWQSNVIYIYAFICIFLKHFPITLQPFSITFCPFCPNKESFTQ